MNEEPELCPLCNQPAAFVETTQKSVPIKRYYCSWCCISTVGSQHDYGATLQWNKLCQRIKATTVKSDPPEPVERSVMIHPGGASGAEWDWDDDHVIEDAFMKATDNFRNFGPATGISIDNWKDVFWYTYCADLDVDKF